VISRLRNACVALHRDESGGPLVEYALFAAIVSVPAYFALQMLGQTLQTLFAASCTGLTSVSLTPQ
jgi:Flp pilus assembly pilin Flp